MRSVVDKLMLTIRDVGYSLSELVRDCLFPKICLGCGQHGNILCSRCFDKIEVARTYTCFYCGKIAPLGKLCPNCRAKHKSGLLRIGWATSYKDPLAKELIHEFKYGGVLEAGEILAEIFSHRLEDFVDNIESPIVIPVPLYYKKLKRRGFNQAEMLARHFSRHFDLHGGLALARIKETDTQVGKTKVEREKNLIGAFVCRDIRLVRGRNIILIDDVVTTGTTLSECARVLKEAGASKIYAAVVARG